VYCDTVKNDIELYKTVKRKGKENQPKEFWSPKCFEDYI